MFTLRSICLAALAVAGVHAAPAPVKRMIPSNVPSYVTKYAPLVWLYSGDYYRPSDIGAQLRHTIPEINFQPVANVPVPLTLSNLGALNALNGSSIYLTSKVDITTNPRWLFGTTPSMTNNSTPANITSCAIISHDHGGGLVDVYYMYFYAFNYGDVVFGELFGDHVGDWEHNMIRFQNGTPTAIWFSQHSFGEAFTYNAVEKQGLRPVSYSGNGTHANYASQGTHDHTIPGFDFPIGPVEDVTDRGVLWDPTLSAYYYTVTFPPTAASNPSAAVPTFAAYDPTTPTSWLDFRGFWGDAQYPSSDPRQFSIFGEARYVGGPTGPWDKQLDRANVCPTGYSCVVQSVVLPGG